MSPLCTTLSPADKLALNEILPSNVYKIIFATRATLYHAPFGTKEWSNSTLKGILVLGQDRSRSFVPAGVDQGEHCWFRLVDVETGRGVIWMHQLSELFDYRMEMAFWHTFRGRSRYWGLRLDDDSEGTELFLQVNNRILAMTEPTTRVIKSQPDRRRISSPLPGSFRHVAHMGVDDISTSTRTV
ncbi:hypothetical protein JAAARDRAFT_36098 [Jaapia argillacea MUCL 33604]|uniref:CRIB domain-containing protein n=1 Tax=Jaapia argillacea MUCL 33604 TaxID=933084 RepID=A0A067Q1Y7_9AGAM|nr:hypothetical protein JAAARDRAFT_36098 [Jaapia argillacea MUCL 33604]